MRAWISSSNRTSRRAMFGMKTLWRGKIKVEISNPSKTIIDTLDDPAIGGGIRHVSDCLEKYLSEKKGTPDELISAAERLGDGTIFKRLGFLAERRGGPEKLIAAAQATHHRKCQAQSWCAKPKVGKTMACLDTAQLGGEKSAVIDRAEILRLANEFGLEARVVEKDYISHLQSQVSTATLSWLVLGSSRVAPASRNVFSRHTVLRGSGLYPDRCNATGCYFSGATVPGTE